MKNKNLFTLLCAFVLVSAGFAFSFWPLVPAGIALLVLYGHTALGITAGLIFDIVWGAPMGMLAFLHFPFLLFALLCVLIRVVALRVILPRGDLDAL